MTEADTETPRKTWRERLNGLKEEASDADHKTLDTVLVSFVSIAAVSAYVFQPIEKFANYRLLFVGGQLVVFMLIAAMMFRLRRGPVIQLYGAIVMLTVAAIFLLFAGIDAGSKSDWNDRRCLRIQDAMLRPTSSTRNDLADVFAAMQCRPQGGAPKPIYKVGRGEMPDAERLVAQQAYEERALASEVDLNKPADLPEPAVPTKTPLRGPAKPGQR